MAVGGVREKRCRHSTRINNQREKAERTTPVARGEATYHNLNHHTPICASESAAPECIRELCDYRAV